MRKLRQKASAPIITLAEQKLLKKKLILNNLSLRIINILAIV